MNDVCKSNDVEEVGTVAAIIILVRNVERWGQISSKAGLSDVKYIQEWFIEEHVSSFVVTFDFHCFKATAVFESNLFIYDRFSSLHNTFVGAWRRRDSIFIAKR